jgi:ferredoxin
MDISREKLNRWTGALGLDLVGVASIEGYRDVAPQWNPLSILPKAKSIVVYAKSIPRSSFRGIEEGTLWMRVNRYLPPRPGYYLCRNFEDNGFLAVPCSPMAQERWPDGVQVKEGKPAPNVTPDIRVAAQLAGLGEIGYNGAFLTPQFGVRQALGMLFTEAEIEVDTPFTAGTLCAGESCLACVKACPAGALSEIPTTCRVGDQTIRVGEYANESCTFCVNGAFPDTSCAGAPPNRLAAACTRACLAHLEDDGVIETSYKAPFRRREAWGYGTFQA